MRPVLSVLSALTLVTYCQPPMVTVTQQASGRSLEVVPVSLSASEAVFKNKAGQSFTVPVQSLTAESVEALRSGLEAVSNAKGDPAVAGLSEELNAAAGHSLLLGGSLWQETGAQVARRLGWPQESQKKHHSSYRLYPDPDYSFLGAHPYCATIYSGAGDRPLRLSLVFANKGDFGSSVGFGQSHFQQMHPGKDAPESLQDAIDLDNDTISAALTAAVGAPMEQFYGERDDRRKVRRWDVGDHAFLLSALKEEYVHLLVVPTEDADKEGKVKFVKDAVLKESHLQNVVTGENGDVWIENIPMVNQGPKGYCVPATFERVMRYMNVPADMYLLATVATSPNGGTRSSLLADAASRIIRSKARRMKDLNLGKDLSIKEVQSYIDKGVPLIWQMRSVDAYDDLVNARSAQRETVQDFADWAQTLQEEADQEDPALLVDDNYHVCMIIGYNEETREIAVSDSWGPRYERRWVHIDIAKAVTTSGGFVVDF